MKVDKSKWKKLQFTKCVTTVKTNPAVQKQDYLDSGAYPIISQEKDIISGYCNTIENLNSDLGELVIFGDHTRVLKYIDFPFCVGADGTKVLKPNPIIKAKYLFYYLIWLNVPNMGYARHFKYLKDSFVTFPSLKEQEGMVAELDRIQGMIDGYKAQIADLDALAQSIFLDTFGDPITNPKGWPIKKFGSSFKLKSGDGLSAKQMDAGPYPVYGGNGVNGSHSQFNKDGSIIIIGRVGVYCGNVRLVKGKFWLTDNAFELIELQEKYNQTFLCYLLMLLNLNEKANQAAQPVISNAALKDISVIIPPLALQGLFATRVKSIEALKVKLREQVADCEMLMAERMQYYFS